MKRYFHLGLIGLTATAMILATPFMTPSANAEEYPLLQELELNDDQKEAVRDIFQDFRGELDDILTDDQKAQFWAAYRELQDVRAAGAAIDDLSDSQKEEIRAAMRETRADLSEVLTDEQLQELRTIRQTRRR